jgi:bacterioferritin
MSAHADAPMNSSERDCGYPFLSEMADIRRRARQHIADGAATVTDAADRDVVLKLLNDALATELACVLRYRRHYYMATGSLAEAIKDDFLKHSQEEQQHADQLSERIVQLGGEPILMPPGMVDRSHFEYDDSESLADMVEEDLIAERIAIESYREIIHYIGEKDATTRRLFESILTVEVVHAEELASMRHELLHKSRGNATSNGTPNQSGDLQ